MTTDFVDPYLDQKTGLLKNLLRITKDQELKSAEADLSYAKELILNETIIARTNDPTELLSIHKFLFEDIYEWAGTIRTVDITKHSDGNFFLIKSKIPIALDFIFGELKNENFLKNLNKETFIKKLSYFYEQLNFIHPFREGNGRTQRVFWNRLALDAGYELDWSKVVGDENDKACRAAMRDQDLSLLIQMFRKITSKIS